MLHLKKGDLKILRLDICVWPRVLIKATNPSVEKRKEKKEKNCYSFKKSQKHYQQDKYIGIPSILDFLIYNMFCFGYHMQTV